MRTDEQYRHECEIRDLCRKTHERGQGWLREYVEGWRRWPAIREDFWRQWKAGNRGEPGDWR